MIQPKPRLSGIDWVFAVSLTAWSGLFTLFAPASPFVAVPAVAVTGVSIVLLFLVYQSTPARALKVALWLHGGMLAISIVSALVWFLIFPNRPSPSAPTTTRPSGTLPPGEVEDWRGIQVSDVTEVLSISLFNIPDPRAMLAHLPGPVDASVIARCWPSPEPIRSDLDKAVITPAADVPSTATRAVLTFALDPSNTPPGNESTIEIEVLIPDGGKPFIIERYAPQKDPTCPPGFPPL